MVEFEVNLKKFYVGLVTKSEGSDGDIEIKFFRRKRHMEEFYLPDADDIASHSKSGIKVVLPMPQPCGSTGRRQRSCKFAYEFSHLNM